MAENLLVGVLGHRNSGKSTTWYELFGHTVRTSQNRPRRLQLNETEWVDVVLVNGSPEERKETIEEILRGDSPRIVLCSMQYHPTVDETLSYFEERDYEWYIQWLNPGFNDPAEYPDELSLRARLEVDGSTFVVRNGKEPPTERAREIRQVIERWARPRGLIRSNRALAEV